MSRDIGGIERESVGDEVRTARLRDAGRLGWVVAYAMANRSRFAPRTLAAMTWWSHAVTIGLYALSGEVFTNSERDMCVMVIRRKPSKDTGLRAILLVAYILFVFTIMTAWLIAVVATSTTDVWITLLLLGLFALVVVWIFATLAITIVQAPRAWIAPFELLFTRPAGPYWQIYSLAALPGRTRGPLDGLIFADHAIRSAVPPGGMIITAAIDDKTERVYQRFDLRPLTPNSMLLAGTVL